MNNNNTNHNFHRSAVRRGSAISRVSSDESMMKQLLLHANNQASLELWQSLRTRDVETVSSRFLAEFLDRAGIRTDEDPRLRDFTKSLQRLRELQHKEGVGGNDDSDDIPLDPGQFSETCSQCISLLRKAATNELAIPNFSAIEQAVREVYEEVLPDRDGQNAQYIPELKNADPEKFGITVCTVDGQQFSIGEIGRAHV